MAKKAEPNLPTRVTPALSVPSYLTQYEGYEADMAEQNASMGEYVIVPRMKIIQGTSHENLTRDFGVGAVIFSPGNALVVKHDSTTATNKSDTFTFNPLFQYTEFMKWKDLKDKDEETPMILDRSFDRTGELAIRARDPKRRFERYGPLDQNTRQPKFQARYIEFLNFLGFIRGDHPLANTPCAISFSRGEFSTGKNFISAVQMRKTPIFTQIWDFNSAFKSRGTERKWWGWEYSPAEEPNISNDEFQSMREQHLGLKKAFNDKLLQVDHTDFDQDEAAEPDGSGQF